MEDIAASGELQLGAAQEGEGGGGEEVNLGAAASGDVDEAGLPEQEQVLLLPLALSEFT